MLKGITIGLLALAAVQDDAIYSNSYKGKAPPELVSEKDQWINSEEKLTLEKLKGRPVWLEFSFIN